jgi:hypothetical protein
MVTNIGAIMAERTGNLTITVRVRWNSISRRNWRHRVEALQLDVTEVQRHGDVVEILTEFMDHNEVSALEEIHKSVREGKVSRSRKTIRGMLRHAFPAVSEDRLRVLRNYVLSGSDSAFAISFRVTGSRSQVARLLGMEIDSSELPWYILEVVGMDRRYGNRVNDETQILKGQGQTKKPGSHRNQS